MSTAGIQLWPRSWTQVQIHSCCDGPHYSPPARRRGGGGGGGAYKCLILLVQRCLSTLLPHCIQEGWGGVGVGKLVSLERHLRNSLLHMELCGVEFMQAFNQLKTATDGASPRKTARSPKSLRGPMSRGFPHRAASLHPPLQGCPVRGQGKSTCKGNSTGEEDARGRISTRARWGSSKWPAVGMQKGQKAARAWVCGAGSVCQRMTYSGCEGYIGTQGVAEGQARQRDHAKLAVAVEDGLAEGTGRLHGCEGECIAMTRAGHAGSGWGGYGEATERTSSIGRGEGTGSRHLLISWMVGFVLNSELRIRRMVVCEEDGWISRFMLPQLLTDSELPSMKGVSSSATTSRASPSSRESRRLSGCPNIAASSSSPLLRLDSSLLSWPSAASLLAACCSACLSRAISLATLSCVRISTDGQAEDWISIREKKNCMRGVRRREAGQRRRRRRSW